MKNLGKDFALGHDEKIIYKKGPNAKYRVLNNRRLAVVAQRLENAKKEGEEERKNVKD